MISMRREVVDQKAAAEIAVFNLHGVNTAQIQEAIDKTIAHYIKEKPAQFEGLALRADYTTRPGTIFIRYGEPTNDIGKLIPIARLDLQGDQNHISVKCSKEEGYDHALGIRESLDTILSSIREIGNNLHIPAPEAVTVVSETTIIRREAGRGISRRNMKIAAVLAVGLGTLGLVGINGNGKKASLTTPPAKVKKKPIINQTQEIQNLKIKSDLERALKLLEVKPQFGYEKNRPAWELINTGTIYGSLTQAVEGKHEQNAKLALKVVHKLGKLMGYAGEGISNDIFLPFGSNKDTDLPSASTGVEWVQRFLGRTQKHSPVDAIRREAVNTETMLASDLDSIEQAFKQKGFRGLKPFIKNDSLDYIRIPQAYFDDLHIQCKQGNPEALKTQQELKRKDKSKQGINTYRPSGESSSELPSLY